MDGSGGTGTWTAVRTAGMAAAASRVRRGTKPRRSNGMRSGSRSDMPEPGRRGGGVRAPG